MAVARVSNVITSTTTGDTVSGPISVSSIKVVGGSGAGSVQLTVSLAAGGNQQIYLQDVAASTTLPADWAPFYINANQTLTINLTGTGTTVHLYCE